MLRRPLRSANKLAGLLCFLTGSLACGQAVVDFQADAVEVTQGLQDLNNSVSLVSNRFTFVRFYAHIKSGATRAFANAELTLFPSGGGPAQTFRPEFGSLELFTFVDRNTYFLFRVPERFATGINVQFQGKVTTRTGTTDPDASNQGAFSTVTFTAVPAPKVKIYRFSALDASCKTVSAPSDVLEKFREYAYLVMPISGVQFSDQGAYDGNVTNTDGSIICGAYWTDLGSTYANAIMARVRSQEQANNPGGFDQDTRYFAFVSGNPTYFRGAARYPGGAPVGSAAAGPVGFDFRGAPDTGPFRTGARGYDMAGWVGAHELGHSYGLYHAENKCGESNAPLTVAFPYTNVYISPTTSNANTDIYGFNVLTLKSYLPTSKDFMSYCMDNPGQWISKQSYQRLMTSLLNNWRAFPTGDKGWPDSRSAESPEPARSATGPAMLVSGFIDLTKPARSLVDRVISATAPISDPITSDYSAVLKAGTTVVARTALKAERSELGPPLAGAPTPDETLTFADWIPQVAGATSLEIQGPQQQVFATLRAGAAVPVVKVVSPNGGENLTASTINISWTASDADFDDRLSYEIALSGDNGASWTSVAPNLFSTNAALPRTSLPACTQCLFRVTATDGLHSASDVSDAVFTLSNQPMTIQVLSPVAGAKGAVNRPMQLLARVSDPDRPQIDDSAITWRSDVGGILGTGHRLTAVFPNVVGKHLITANIVDGGVTVRSTPVEIEILASDTDLAPKDLTVLEADQDGLSFVASAPAQSYQIALTSRNPDPAAILTWTAATSQPWVRLGTSTGTTPGSLQVSLGDVSALAAGTSDALVTITAAGLPSVLIPVTFNKPVAASAVTLDVGGAVNAADYSYRITAGMIASVFGKGLATKVTVAPAGSYPKSLDGVSVEVIEGSKVTQAPLYFVSPTQINFQLPSVISSSSVRVRVKNALGTSGEEGMQITRNQPAVFTRDLSGKGPAIAVRQPSYALVETATPLRPLDNLYVYVTGIGPTTPSIAEGIPGGDNATLGPVNFSADTVQIKFAGQTFAPQFAGLAPGFAGVFQVNFQVPSTIDDTNCSLRIVVNGVESQSGVTIPCRK